MVIYHKFVLPLTNVVKCESSWPQTRIGNTSSLTNRDSWLTTSVFECLPKWQTFTYKYYVRYIFTVLRISMCVTGSQIAKQFALSPPSLRRPDSWVIAVRAKIRDNYTRMRCTIAIIQYPRQVPRRISVVVRHIDRERKRVSGCCDVNATIIVIYCCKY